MALGMSGGVASYIESGEPPYQVGTGGTRPTDLFITRGAWLGLEGAYRLTSTFALAMRGRIGWLRRGPPTVLDREARPGADTSALDPQLGDAPVGGAIAPFGRILLPSAAVDVGFTVSLGSFAPRLGGGSIPFAGDPCGDCASAQGAFNRLAIWPTLRVSSAERGFYFSVGTGETFVRTYEIGLLEALLGHRGEKFEFRAGIGRGLALRGDFRVHSDHWISLDFSLNPFHRNVPGYASARSIFTVTLTRRGSSFAPL